MSTPREYLRRSLLRPGYIWSVTGLFDHYDRDAARRTDPLTPEELTGPRGEMYRFLDHRLSVAEFTPEWREPLGELAERYARVDEMLRPPVARRYRQSGTPAALGSHLRRRVEQLLAEADRLGQRDRQVRLLALSRLRLDGAPGPVLQTEPYLGWEALTTRSAILTAIGRARQSAGETEGPLLDDLTCVTYRAYILLAAGAIGSSCLLTVRPGQQDLLLRGTGPTERRTPPSPGGGVGSGAHPGCRWSTRRTWRTPIGGPAT